MTMLTLNSAQLDTLSLDFQAPASQQGSGPSSPGRFNLRKRSVPSDQPDVNLGSYNSDFLSGLFADVASAHQDSNDSQEEASPVQEQVEDHSDPRLDTTLSVKRSRTSLTKSISRCGRSFANLAHLQSPVAVELFDDCTMPSPASTSELGQSSSMKRMDSLHFQLGCVGISPKSIKSVVDIVDMAFPHLPPTVSDSSCKQGDLTQKPVRAVPDCETRCQASSFANDGDDKKESYGWFVDMDDQDEEPEHSSEDPYATGDHAAATDLAFQAPTAPKGKSNHQAEVEFALAADTVDDVLGDFF